MLTFTYKDVEKKQQQLAKFNFDYADIYSRAYDLLEDGDIAVELGTFLGTSACYMGQLIKEGNKNIIFYSVDLFQQYAKAQSFYKMVMHHLILCGLRDEVRLLVANSWESAGFFKDEEVSFCWVDAGHDFDSVRKDLAAWYKKIKPGGILAGHDYSELGVRLAVDEFAMMHKLDIEILHPDGWKSWWLRKPKKKGSL